MARKYLSWSRSGHPKVRHRASGQPRERPRGRRERKQKMQYECGRGAWIRSPICVMTRLIQRRLCSKFAALRQHGKFPNLKQLMPDLVPDGEQETIAPNARWVPT